MNELPYNTFQIEMSNIVMFQDLLKKMLEIHELYILTMASKYTTTSRDINYFIFLKIFLKSMNAFTQQTHTLRFLNNRKKVAR